MKVQVAYKEEILIQSTHKRTNEIYYKKITRRIIEISSGLYEYQYQGKRCYARRAPNGKLYSSFYIQKFAHKAA